MTLEELRKEVVKAAKQAPYEIKYFTVNTTNLPHLEVISFHEHEDDEIGGVLPDMLTIKYPDTLLTPQLTAGMRVIRQKGNSYTYYISELNP